MNATTGIDPRLAKHRRRKRVNQVALVLALAAMAFGVFWLVWILIEIFRLGFSGDTDSLKEGLQRLAAALDAGAWE